VELGIEVEQVSQVFAGGAQALRDVNLRLGPGLFGLLGPNGAGKTTLMSILATLRSPTSGRARVLGHDVVQARAQVRRCLGYLPQSFGAYPSLSASEFLGYMARLSGRPEQGLDALVEHTLEQVGLQAVRARRVKKLSGGMLRRLGVAQAIIGNPSALILDEPTVGLDPEERVRFRELIRTLARERVVLLSTHIVGDIDAACEDMALLDRGQVLYRGSPRHFVEQAQGHTFERVLAPGQPDGDLRGLTLVARLEQQHTLRLRLVGEHGGRADLQVVAPNLEDAYLFFMNHRTLVAQA
jgi:ABC-type multidrug transport system ATPase subunit